jgi:putative flippase GtrA
MPDTHIASRRDSLLRSLAGEGLRMALLSLASLALGYGLTLAFHSWFAVPSAAAFSAAILICSVINFFGCRHYVFRGTKAPLWQEALKFFPSVLAFRAVEVALFAGFNALLHNYHAAYFATTGISLAGKLFVSRVFIFKRPL